MDYSRYITVDPAVCHGQPVFRDTRVLVHVVLEILATGESATSVVHKTFPQLTDEHIRAALAYASALAQAGHVVTVSQMKDEVAC